MMKSRANNNLKGNSDSDNINLIDCSGDLDNEVTVAPQRTIRRARRRGGLGLTQCRNERGLATPVQMNNRSHAVLVCFAIAFSLFLWYLSSSHQHVSTISSFLPKEISSYLFGEQCNSMWTTKDLPMLRNSFEKNVFGQHIAIKLILSVLSRRWTQSDADVKKPLVMSFHGWTGSGKNYISKFIAEALFDRGLRSKFVHLFVSTLHFYDESDVVKYRLQLQDWVRGNVSRCEDSLFIIDEVDKMPPGVLDGLKPYMDFHTTVDGVDFRRATFILLSNTGGREVTQKTMDFWQEGRQRESMTYFDLEGLVTKGAFNEKGGLQQSSIIDRSLIDVYIPFCPWNNHPLGNASIKS